MSHRVKLSIIVASALALAVFVLSFGFVWGASDQRNAADRAAVQLQLSAPSTGSSAAVLSQASQLATKQQYDQAIALLTPFTAKTSEPKDLRVLAMQLVAQYQQAKGNLTASISWNQQSETLNGAARLNSTLGIASTAAHLYAQQSGNPATAASAQQYKQMAITSYSKALTLTTDKTILDQTNQQLAAITKTP